MKEKRWLSVVLVLCACAEVPQPAQLVGVDVDGAARDNAPFIAFALGASERHACAFAPGSNLQCWGTNSSGQIGNGSTGGMVESPEHVPGPRFSAFSAGGNHSCALTDEGAAYCWGGGILGTGGITGSPSPVAVDTDLRFVDIGAGFGFTCGLTQDGAAWCWGQGNAGQLGTAAPDNCSLTAIPRPCARRPVAVQGGHVFASIDVGLWNVCGLTAAGAALCWGENSFGQLGIGARTSPVSAPTAVLGDLRFRELSVGAVHMCGITTGGVAYCWGDNRYGNLGIGSTTRSLTPTAVAGAPTFATIRASKANNILLHSCAVATDGTGYCWGANQDGKLGIGPGLPICDAASPNPIFRQPCALIPRPIETTLRFAAIELGNPYSCGITSQHRAYCWGSNINGALGNASVETGTPIPTPVSTWSKGPARTSPPSPPSSAVTLLDGQSP